MDDGRHAWLDALTDGTITRSWLALYGNFWTGALYWIVLFGGFALALATIPIIVGIPLLLFMLAVTRDLAALDRRMMAAVLGIDAHDTPEDIDMRGANLGERLGMLLGSGRTWRSLLYLLLKFPVGVVTLTASLIWLLPLAVEVLLLAPLTIDLRLITVRILRWTARAQYRALDWLLPSRPAKRRSRLELVEERIDDVDDDVRYYIDSEGEIAVAKRR